MRARPRASLERKHDLAQAAQARDRPAELRDVAPLRVRLRGANGVLATGDLVPVPAGAIMASTVAALALP